MSIKLLSAKFGFTPPPRKGPKMRKENLYKSGQILKNDTFSGGGVKRDLVDKAILWTSGRFCLIWGFSDSLGWVVQWGFQEKLSHPSCLLLSQEDHVQMCSKTLWGDPGQPASVTYPWGRLDYICNSKTNIKSESVSEIFGKIIWKHQGRKNHDSHRRDRIWRDFLHRIFRYFLQILWGSSY